ncbi:hypothetical protein ACRE_005090 [Hapsidospora chrysogenum ATCC 11550]|uniref:Methyltransferase type 11 domain-containing protein n=1 Tax=Hapsidospora chrysogenum (strain ATCC 11550 / CBS 779.69 / DSM 880 / IAM 14645 / JCM 23072 / IMI 49137) TaxID=857340 RepID=A0A086TH75_HAPC1|nr:hypothetical protein ACRE_005090 [Hapsidospora chrysogenum ATCC 11550]
MSSQKDEPLEQQDPPTGTANHHPRSTAASAPAANPTSTSNSTADDYEAEHVHSVYEAIAPHFSATRHKPWPLVASFLHAQPPGAVGLDVGCGNGKYLDVNARLHLLGSDRSEALVRLARDRRYQPGSPSPAEALVADGLALPYRPACADFVISIAVVHHLSTRDRRRAAIAALLECARPQAPVLVFAWALEQSSSRRGFHEGCDQDTLVPWVMRTQPSSSKASGDAAAAEGAKKKTTAAPVETTYQRYYHLFREGELEEDVAAVGGVVLDGGYERDNWWVICSRERPEKEIRYR